MHAFKKRVRDHLLRLEPYPRCALGRPPRSSLKPLSLEIKNNPAPIETCLERSLSMCIYVRVSDPKAIFQRLSPKSRQRPDSGSQRTRGSRGPICLGPPPGASPHWNLQETCPRCPSSIQCVSISLPFPALRAPKPPSFDTEFGSIHLQSARAARSARRFPGSPPGRP